MASQQKKKADDQVVSAEVVSTPLGGATPPASEEEKSMGQPVPSADKVTQLANWLVPFLRQHSISVARRVMTGEIKSSEYQNVIEAKLAPSVQKTAEEIAQKIVDSVKEIKL